MPGAAAPGRPKRPARPPLGLSARGSKSACADLDGPKRLRLWRSPVGAAGASGGASSFTVIYASAPLRRNST